MQNGDRLSGHSAFSPVRRKFHATDAVILALFGLLLVVGLGMLGGSLSLLSEPWRKRSWLETPARMLTCEAVRKGRDATKAEVLYSYEFSGREYRSDRTNFGLTLGSVERRFVEAHPAGSTLTVFVDPVDPASAVIERSPSGALLLLPLAGAFIVLPVCFFHAWRRGWRRRLRPGEPNPRRNPYRSNRARRRRTRA
ncbi:MAG: hypothetical protein JWO82_2658 [Akkermansiaceae bacterium]|nr:hypothetical protein [Akkermansiaceae bacterium]